MSDGGQSNPQTSGWYTFSAILFALAGIGNLVWGVHALEDDSALVAGGVVWFDLETWGAIALIWGAIVLLASGLLFLKKMSGAVLAILLASISATFWFFVLPAAPIFSLVAIMLNAMVIYGLAVSTKYSSSP